jgi:TetR/AcrR family transcriptional repressor of nem operon
MASVCSTAQSRTSKLSNGSDETRVKLADVLDRWEEALAACLREAQERSELDSATDPDQLAAIMIEAYEGAVMRGKVEQNGNALERFENVR